MPATTRLLATSQAAEVLGIKKGTLDIWRHYGKGPPHIKIGRNVRYAVEDLEAFISDQRRTSTSDSGQ